MHYHRFHLLLLGVLSVSVAQAASELDCSEQARRTHSQNAQRALTEAAAQGENGDYSDFYKAVWQSKACQNKSAETS